MCACNHREGKPTYRYKVNLNMADLLYMDGVSERCAPHNGFLQELLAQGGVHTKILAQDGVHTRFLAQGGTFVST